MPRVARVVVPGVPHHVTQRGNNGQRVFFTNEDRAFYLAMLAKKCREAEVRVMAYCLMPNHVHLILVPSDASGMSKALCRTHQTHALRINRIHDRSGHLWQSRFYSSPMDDAHTVAAMRYVERNPVRAKMVRMAWEYRWSSAAAHCGMETAHPIIEPSNWARRYPPDSWRTMLRGSNDDTTKRAIRDANRCGRPLGTEQFISRLESELGRALRSRRMGRPPKSRK